MNDIQKLQLEMLVKLDEVCRKHGLRYYLAYGTCIGAMRHNGFIPWDHDVDVLMPIEDAVRLERYQKEFGDYFIASRRTDSSFKLIDMSIVDTKHKCEVIKDGRVIKKRNVNMDIYPFYNCPPTKVGLLANIMRSHLYKLLVGGIPQNHGKVAVIASKLFMLFFSEKNRERDIRRIEKKLRYRGRSFEIADYYGLDITFLSAITYKKEWFDKPKELIFEGYHFYGPTNPHAYLTKRYGDYMTPPSKSAISEEVVIKLINEEENENG
ncbi:lipopolysaccharide cholinephosphotransferase [Ruminococcus sp. YRD2003]|uniref:LicD family protein n=1 Tax=Ruminococcus sp. YRD2003 TaxID=1452313 RepID=UPI0008C634DE|nr:lipopolysaccharide cholinephosphotransferase [Ruminococcus flavefaciens]